MQKFAESVKTHRVQAADVQGVVRGEVRYAPAKSAVVNGYGVGRCGWRHLDVQLAAFAVFVLTTDSVLLLGHSLGSHRKFHDSYQCPKGLEYMLVYFGVQVGLTSPIGLLGQHDLRDYAQRLPDCHDYLRHGRSFWQDA